MRIFTDFDIVPDTYAKRAPQSAQVDGTPVASFPFTVEQIPSQAAYLSWEFVDPDSIPVCGFQWIHWSLANLPLELARQQLQASANAADALAIPADFSRRLPKLIPGVPQGKTSAASKFVGSSNLAVTERYNGPTPPDQTHEYLLRVWATSEPLPGLQEGFWLNALEGAVRKSPSVVACAEVWLPARA
ncbi:hypothetical protein KIM372_16440 [Bombiscardovia nodaiensis]|uniref:Phospholipid-binding protein n=1 Tax=Bombiscardovia nodaiensis TaxID=2932181 RepID=A0ABN6SEP3_9BIFI|nr:hypothetical protein KIM372_16440 [Bombiscardovia nodaiensis]